MSYNAQSNQRTMSLHTKHSPNLSDVSGLSKDNKHSDLRLHKWQNGICCLELLCQLTLCLVLSCPMNSLSSNSRWKSSCVMPCGLEKAGVKCKHLPSQKKRNQRGDFISKRYSFLFWSAISTLPKHCIFVVSYNTGWCIHTFFCAVFLSPLNSIVIF